MILFILQQQKWLCWTLILGSGIITSSAAAATKHFFFFHFDVASWLTRHRGHWSHVTANEGHIPYFFTAECEGKKKQRLHHMTPPPPSSFLTTHALRWNWNVAPFAT